MKWCIEGEKCCRTTKEYCNEWKYYSNKEYNFFKKEECCRDRKKRCGWKLKAEECYKRSWEYLKNEECRKVVEDYCQKSECW